jgi:twitching motility protein PilT
MDTESFATALKAVTRQDPDVIVLGDVPDATSIEAIMRAAEIGKLAIASVSAADAPHAVDRLVGMFAPAEQESVRVRVIEALSAVISQKLVSRAEGEGLVVAVEVARGTPEVRDALRDPTRAADDLPGVIAAGRDSQAMQTFDQHLADLVEAEVISPAVAKTAARDPKTFSGKKR